MYRSSFVLGWIVSIGGQADAAPWTQDKGDVYFRTAVAYETLQSESLWREDVYAEYGLADKWTVTAKAEATQFQDVDGFNSEAYRATIRHRLWESKGVLLAVEAGAVRGTTSAGVFGCDDWGGELRVSGGASGKLRGRDFHVFLDAAQLQYEDGCRRSRLELGVGSHLGGRFHLSQQYWYETGNVSADSLKIQSQITYRTDGGVDFAFGHRQEVGGEFQERSLLIAVTLRH